MLEGRRRYLSNCATIATLNGGLLAAEITMMVIGMRPWNELVFVTMAVDADLLRRVNEVFNPEEQMEKRVVPAGN